MKIEIEIPDSVINELFYQAHSRYWADNFTWNGKTGKIREHMEESDEKPVWHKINGKSIKVGIANLAIHVPYIFGKLIANDLDGPMSDVVLQFCAGVTVVIDGKLTSKYG